MSRVAPDTVNVDLLRTIADEYKHRETEEGIIIDAQSAMRLIDIWNQIQTEAERKAFEHLLKDDLRSLIEGVGR